MDCSLSWALTCFQRMGTSLGRGMCRLGRAVGKSWHYNCKASNFVPLSIGWNSFIHSINIHKISSMCWMLEIQSIHLSFYFTMLNVAPVPSAPKCPCALHGDKCPDVGSGVWVGLREWWENWLQHPSGGRRQMRGLIQFEIRVHW